MGIHSLREQVFKALFSLDVLRNIEDVFDPLEPLTRYLDFSCDDFPTRKERRYIIKKATAVFNMSDRIDLDIDNIARGWTTRYIGKIELNILRLAIYEIKYDEKVPPKVAVNEAVELAKVYGGTNSPSFVNGILKHFMKDETDILQKQD